MDKTTGEIMTIQFFLEQWIYLEAWN